MRFFTIEWWNALQDPRIGAEEIWRPQHEFAAHMDSIRRSLPADFQKLFDESEELRAPLHDATMRTLTVDDGTLALEFETTGRVLPRSVRALYADLRSFSIVQGNNCGLASSAGFGTYGYDEADILEPGIFEHRILFSSGIELRIAFGDYRLSSRS